MVSHGDWKDSFPPGISAQFVDPMLLCYYCDIEGCH